MEEFTTAHFFGALLLVCVFLMAGHLLKNILFKRLIVPPSLIGGLIALGCGPQLLGGWLGKFLPDEWGLKGNLIAPEMVSIWKEMPAYWITVVFAGLFLGSRIPKPRQIFNESLPNLAFGYTLALGQYVVGMLIAALFLGPVFGVDVLSGALIAIGFQGGHGTVAGLGNTFNDLGFSEGTDLGLGIATIGLISAIVFGTVMSNLGRDNESGDLKLNHDERKRIEVTDVSFPLQMGILASTIAIAWIVLEGLVALESAILPEDSFRIFQYIPLFPVAMLCGLAVQVTARSLGWDSFISKYHINAISNLALDLLIVAALGSLSLQALQKNASVVLILAGVGVAYNLTIYYGLARYVFGEGWRVRGLGELGQSMGTTAIGLILIKQGSPKNADYVKAFSYKQPFYEPIVGGGLVTALSLPFISNLGPWVFLGCVVVGIVTLAGVYFKIRP